MRIKRWSIALTSIALLSGGYWYFFVHASSAVAAPNQVIRVSLGSISTSVKTTGKISPVQTTVLSFSKQGTVSRLYKKVGESVKAGDVIAEIDAKSAYMDIESARLSLANAKNNYNKLFESATESEKIRAKNTFEESQANLKLLQAQYENLLITEKNNLSESDANVKLLTDKVALALSDLEYTKKNVSTDTTSNNLEKDIQNAYLALEDLQKNLSTTMKQFREAMYIDWKSDQRYGDLSAKDASMKSRAESLYNTLSGNIISYNSDLSNLRSTPIKTFDGVYKLIQSGQSVLSDLNSLGALIIGEYDASNESASLPSDFISSTKTAIGTTATSLSNRLASLNSTLATLKNYGNDDLQKLADTNTVTTKEQSLTSTKNDLSKAQSEYELLKESQETERVAKQQDIEKQKNTIALSEATYNELLKGPVNTEKVGAENSIASANISLQKASLALRDYQIIAPFDGRVNDIPWKIGDTTTTSAGVLVENKNAYEIALSLDQIDIVKIKEGMKANIVLDAFPTETYTGKVSRISEVPTETSGVVSYEAVVELTIPRSDIYTKMSATVEVITTEKENILTIPLSAITTEGGKSYVNKATDPSIFTRLMNTGRTGSGTGGGRSFTGGTRGTFSGSGGFSPGERNFSGSGEMTGSGRTGSGRGFSGSINTGSGNTVGGSRRARSGNNIPTASTTETIPTEKIEITIGVSSNGQTEVISGLSAGDVIVVVGKTSTAKSGTPASSTTRAPGAGGFGGGRPPGL